MPIMNAALSDTLTASADIRDEAEVWIPGDGDPFTPVGIAVEYSATTGRHGRITVRGYERGAGDADISERAVHDLDYALPWVRRFVADHRPAVPAAVLRVVQEWRGGGGISVSTPAEQRLWNAVEELCLAAAAAPADPG